MKLVHLLGLFIASFTVPLAQAQLSDLECTPIGGPCIKSSSCCGSPIIDCIASKIGVSSLCGIPGYGTLPPQLFNLFKMVLNFVMLVFSQMAGGYMANSSIISDL
ncbi:hypothetical protein GE061_005303 [Apolygus lucorum]|uniref:Uncharacterized protein n=1 Tax=Apolygus lucorum TaxID=248454 RepID=A0A6A4IXW2_APOLU|nr:hypothetical protein GE061_005303 [Apolygus lucorum]